MGFYQICFTFWKTERIVYLIDTEEITKWQEELSVNQMFCVFQPCCQWHSLEFQDTIKVLWDQTLLSDVSTFLPWFTQSNSLTDGAEGKASPRDQFFAGWFTSSCCLVAASGVCSNIHQHHFSLRCFCPPRRHLGYLCSISCTALVYCSVD